MREAYGLEGVPLIIDFVPHSGGRGAPCSSRLALSSTLLAMPTSKPLAEGEHLFTSESVTEGHPDKVADQISDGVLDAIMAEDPERPRRLRDPGQHRHGGGLRRDLDRRPTSTSRRSSARRSAEIGYDDGDYGYDCDHISVLVSIDKQ